ncbi:TIGR02452 family protein [Wenjunlia tyrosinilytica]|uniref:TIGR02452 family protein n=1 Tax=Wenjunlia tyrosinilytica TaxID=1544741 RepID=A0A917ZIP1_9ACTN|nr:TIGR02452 family protein [Wenjunlia tyrosinilytica]GGO83969.1 TIGR02452 family protein [Wenjunlia tyrosinilytica]
MSTRLRAIAKQTDRINESGWYTAPSGRVVKIGEQIATAVRGTRVHGPDPVDPEPVAPDPVHPEPMEVPETARTATAFEVTPEGSLAAAGRMLDEDRAGVAVLNFASARNPGGGFLNGAQAQEEYLCRNSALHACLRGQREFYEAHRADPSPFYSDRVIHSPAVPVFRGEDNTLLEEPLTVGFLTSAAPNAGVIVRRDPAAAARVPEALAVRAERVLEVAVLGGYRRLVLGAWGCGVFQNRPEHVAGAFAALLGPGGRFAGRFSRVVFAVLDRRADSPTREAFVRAFPPDGR